MKRLLTLGRGTLWRALVLGALAGLGVRVATAGSNGVGTGGLQGFPTVTTIPAGAAIGPGCVVTATGINCAGIDAGNLNVYDDVAVGDALTAGGTIQGNDVQVPSGRAVYLNGSTRTVGFSTDGTTIRVLGVLPFGPNTDQSINLGSSGVRWSNAFFGGKVSMPANGTSCTLDGGSPSQCDATVTASAVCQCTPRGSTAALAAAGCAVSLTSTTLTATSLNGGTHVVNILCDR